jgi:hypothetical protein
MKKFIVSSLLTFSLILSSISYNSLMLTKNFDATEVKETIHYLSSDEFKGRLSGTLENALVGAYIKDEFEHIGLEPLSNGYYQSFQVNYPKSLSDEPMIAVIDKDRKIHKILEYGVNYKEDLLNFRNTEIEFDNLDISSRNNDAISVSNDMGTAIFYTSSNNTLGFRSSFYEESNKGLFVTVTKETLAEIENYLNEGFSIYTYIPYSIEEASINNIVGVIKGKDSSLPPLILGAHFDHIGTDLGGTVYNGALDNASGVSFLLQLAKYIKTLGIPDRDIIFVSFNAEEFGLKGSKAFVNEYKDLISGSRVYNFDMIGSYDGTPLCIMAGKTNTAKTPIVEELTKAFQDKKIYFNYVFENSSDHSSFVDAGIEAVTLCDYDLSRIHTPNDKIEYISEEAIDRCFSVIKAQIFKDSYSSNVLYNHLELILFLSLGASLILSAIYYNIKKSS